MIPRHVQAVSLLRSERLQLVPLEARHEEPFATLHANPETMRFIGNGAPLDRVGAWFHLAMLIGHWQLRGYGVWAVEIRRTGEFAGRVGFLHPEGWAEPELNWMIRPDLRGRGFATEAARVALQCGFRQLGFTRIMSLIRPDNTTSRQVAGKLGATYARSIDFLGSPTEVFYYPRVAGD